MLEQAHGSIVGRWSQAHSIAANSFEAALLRDFASLRPIHCPSLPARESTPLPPPESIRRVQICDGVALEKLTPHTAYRGFGHGLLRRASPPVGLGPLQV